MDVDISIGLEIHVVGYPSVRREAAAYVLRERNGRIAFDGDAVVVPDDTQIREVLRPGEGGSLRADALLKIAIGCDDPDHRIERRRWTGRVQHALLVPRRHGHPDGSCDTLAEWSSRHLNARGMPEFRVARGCTPEGAEGGQVGELQSVATEEELCVEGQRRMPGREHEPITPQPVRVRRIMSKECPEEHGRSGCQTHGGARMPIACGLNGIHGQRSCMAHNIVVLWCPGEGHVRSLFTVVLQELDRLQACRQWFASESEPMSH